MLFLQLLHISSLKTGFVFIGVSINKVSVGLALFVFVFFRHLCLTLVFLV